MERAGQYIHPTALKEFNAYINYTLGIYNVRYLICTSMRCYFFPGLKFVDRPFCSVYRQRREEQFYPIILLLGT